MKILEIWISLFIIENMPFVHNTTSYVINSWLSIWIAYNGDTEGWGRSLLYTMGRINIAIILYLLAKEEVIIHQIL